MGVDLKEEARRQRTTASEATRAPKNVTLCMRILAVQYSRNHAMTP